MSTPSTTPMGKSITTLTITNRIDQAKAKEGLISSEDVRSLTLENVLVDTGATTLCLPSDAIAQLGLELLKEVDVSTAVGFSKAKIFQDARISLLGREGTFECLELPGGRDPLLGVIPLEALGVELDLKNQQLRVLPETSMDTYLTIL
ncbi:MAG: aspartyl protease family protein [Spirulinaceae cyanobacterium]